jgi:endonuclease/exonuclease/phosphatase family metal-dependent hydrolase
MSWAILTANIAGDASVPPLRAAIRETRPDVVIVTEAQRARRFLRGIGGYELYQYTRHQGREAPGVAVLVRHGLRVLRRRPMRMRQPWAFHRPRGPRTYPVLVLANGADRLPLLGVHFPTGGPSGPNAAAWWESWRRAAGWLSRHDRAVAAGDWNALQAELARLLPPALQLVVGTKVDHAVTHGMRHNRTRRLDPPPGMHGWILYKLQGSG